MYEIRKSNELTRYRPRNGLPGYWPSGKSEAENRTSRDWAPEFAATESDRHSLNRWGFNAFSSVMLCCEALMVQHRNSC
jgi:hypothetical protein